MSTGSWFYLTTASSLLSRLSTRHCNMAVWSCSHSNTSVSRFMGSRSHPHRVLSVCMCVCVSRCLWVCVIEADSLQLRVITVGLYQFLSRSLSCQILAVFAVDVYGPFWFLVPRFLSPAFLNSNSWALLLSRTPIAGDSSAHCFPALPASAFEELHFSFSYCITSCNKLSFPQLNPPVFIVTEGSDQSSWIQRRLVVCRNC